MDESSKHIKSEIDYARKYYAASDSLLIQRFSFFLVAESMLVVAVVTIMNSECRNLWVENAICILGVFYTTAWYFSSLSILSKMNALVTRYLVHCVVFRYATKQRYRCVRYLEKKFKPIMRLLGCHDLTDLFVVHFLPIVTLVFWCFIFFIK